jgi:hypothetical protein
MPGYISTLSLVAEEGKHSLKALKRPTLRHPAKKDEEAPLPTSKTASYNKQYGNSKKPAATNSSSSATFASANT